MDRTPADALWVDGGIRREAFFFGPADEPLYGALYASDPPSRRFGVVVCSSWGFEAARTDRLAHSIAFEMARLGGAGIVFHPPGYGDSHGDLGAATMQSLAGAAVAAVEEASRRLPGTEWILVGLMLGASIACLARQSTDVDRLLLIQPALSPSEYFGYLARCAQQFVLRDGPVDFAFAFPLPRRLLDAGPENDRAVQAAVDAFDGEGMVVNYAEPDGDDPATREFVRVTVPGAWRFAAVEYSDLQAATLEHLDRATKALGTRA